MKLPTITLFALLAAAAACSDDSPSTPDAGPDGGTDWDGGVSQLKGACDPRERVGKFMVEHTVDFTSVSGEVREGVIPAKVKNLDNEAAGCRLWHTVNPECDPACDPGQTCSHENECIPYPEKKSVGSVIIEGLNKAVTVEPPNYFDTEMPQPGFDPGASIKMEAAGADYPGFTMYGRGVTPIAINSDPWVIKEHEDLELTWVPADDEDAYVEISLNVDMHGVSPIDMVCELEDTGSATVPASLIDEFLDNGVTGFATAIIYRKTSDKIDIEPGCVDFQIVSRIGGNLEVEGHVPCTGPGQCPEGYVCDIPIQTCVPE